jgi:hypothetical protein
VVVVTAVVVTVVAKLRASDKRNVIASEPQVRVAISKL